MDEFLAAWDNVASNYEGHHDMKPRVIRDLFYEQWKTSKVLKSDVDHYDRQPGNSPEKTIEFMRSSMERHQNRNRVARNREAQTKLYSKGANQNNERVPGAAATTDGGGRGGGNRGGGGKGGGGKRDRGDYLGSGQREPSKGRGKSPARGGEDRKHSRDKDLKDCGPRDYCFYFQDGTCQKPQNECPWHHVKAPKAIREQMKEPSGKPRSRSNSRSRGGDDGKKGDKSLIPKHCPLFLRSGECNKDPCKPHLNREAFNREKGRINNLNKPAGQV